MDGRDPYQTMPEKKSFNREKIRCIKDPMGETKYAYHINYHPESSTDNFNGNTENNHFQGIGNNNVNITNTNTIPHNTSFNGNTSNTIRSTNSNNSSTRGNGVLPQEQQQYYQQIPPQVTPRAIGNERKVGFAGNEVQVLPTYSSSSNLPRYVNSPAPVPPPKPNGGSLKGEQMAAERISLNSLQAGQNPYQGSSCGSSIYSPRSFRSEGGFDAEAANKPKPDTQPCCKNCSAPPWWAWLIIILITCLLVAVLYFITARELEGHNTTTNPGAIASISKPTVMSSSQLPETTLTNSTYPLKNSTDASS